MVDFEGASRASSAESMARRGWKGSSYYNGVSGYVLNIEESANVVLLDIVAVEAFDIEECSMK